jgi:hypothetical protein
VLVNCLGSSTKLSPPAVTLESHNYILRWMGTEINSLCNKKVDESEAASWAERLALNSSCAIKASAALAGVA